MISKTIGGLVAASLAVIALTGCAGNSQPTPTPTQTALASPLTAEEAWDSFAQIADTSCKTAYEGLVEEDIEGPNTGKLKIRLTFDQAGENSFAVKMPDGTLDFVPWMEYYACEASHLIHNLETDGYSYENEIPPYSVDWPLTVSFDHVNATYLTTQLDDAGNERKLVYMVAIDVFSIVENLSEGSKTKLTFGLPGAAMTAIVNQYYSQ